MVIQQTIDIPADRRIYFDLPESVPTGNVNVTLSLKKTEKISENEVRIVDWILHPVQTYRRVSWGKTQAFLNTEYKKHGPVFGGIDGLEFQRMIRDGWKGRP